jgi:hypothetical protein
MRKQNKKGIILPIKVNDQLVPSLLITCVTWQKSTAYGFFYDVWISLIKDKDLGCSLWTFGKKHW